MLYIEFLASRVKDVKEHLASAENSAESDDSEIKQEPCSHFPAAPQLLEYEKGRISHEKSRLLA